MYLKKIGLCGFKSFADRITLNFQKDHITGIVGPNGSGKSNVIDAVRWVMGEQNTKMLRGEKATDIIFSGSERRKALGMAEVALTFDNSENSPHCPPEYRFDEEIVLTRRLYSDGQREFLINRKPCRLKDIVGFFISSGLGSRSYSMIQQGQVDRILQAKPEELREIIEEAAGTKIFKKRRAETQKKLEATQVNLSRIDDILKEITDRKENLREQADKAEKWRNLSDSLKQKEYEYHSQSFLNLREKISTIDKSIFEDTKHESSILADLSAGDLEHKKLQDQLEKADPEVAIITEQIAQVREKTASVEVRLMNALDLLETGENRLKELEKKMKEENKNLGEFEKQCKQSEKEYTKSQKEAQQASKTLEKLEKQIDHIEQNSLDKEESLQELQDETKGIEKLLDANKIRLEHILQQTENYRRQKEEYTKKLIVLESDHSQALILTDSAQVKVKQQQKNINKIREEKEKLKVTINKKIEEQEDIKNRLEVSKNSYIELSAHVSHLEDSKKQFNDVKSSLVEVKKKTKIEDFYFLTEAVSFNEKKLPKAVVSAFDQWSNRLIVKDIKHIAVLEDAVCKLKIGKTFVTLANEEASVIKESVSWAKKQGLDPIEKYLNLQKPHQDSSNNVLSRVFVHHNKSTPMQKVLASLYRDVVVITQNGTIHTNKKDMAIGLEKADGLLLLKTKEAELKTKIEKAVEKINKQKAEEKAVSDQLKKMDITLEDSNQRYFDANKELISLLGDFQKQEQKANHKQELINTLRKDYEELVEKNKAVEQEINDLKKNNQTFSEEKNKVHRQLQELKEESKAYQENQDDIKGKIEDIRLQKISAQTRFQTLKIGYDQLKTQLDLLKNQSIYKDDDYDHLKQSIKVASTERKQFQEDIKAMAEEKKRFEKRLSEKRNENMSLSKELKKTEDKLKKINQRKEAINAKMNEKNLEKEKIKFSISSMVEQCQEQHKIDLNKEKITKIENFNAKNHSRQIASLKERIVAIGPINMMAIDEFKELDERHSFIEAQKKEIVSSIDLLELAIEEISETAKEKFVSTFVVLNKEFQELFPILFPRGEGKIVIESLENPLDADVEIVVRLPGKSQQNMRLFSGGEKALTAIALIFALLKSKPTPFCFLDEVDAALDEANVIRYNRVLEALSDRFQFIVITHRRKTMEALDTLYGVTMQEPGVSKVVGVDLTKDLPAHLQKSFSEKTLKQTKSTNYLL